MKRVLITGEHGTIALCLGTFLREKVREFEVSFLNVRGGGWRKERFSGYDAIVHAAALVHQKETTENAALYQQVNRDLTVELAEKAKMEGMGQFVFLSTGGVYGLTEGVITKDTVPRPVINYARTKLEAEEALISMMGDGFAVAILRPLMVYGKGCKGNYQTLEKLARIALVLPAYENRRGLVSVDTLCTYIEGVIRRREEGIFFPREREDVCTCRLIQQIAAEQGRKLIQTRLLNPAVGLLRTCTSAGKKAFGNLVYQDLDRLPLSEWKK